MGLLWEAGLGESCDRADPVDPAEPTEPELPTEFLVPRRTTLFLWLAGFTVTMRLWLLATIMSVTWNDHNISDTAQEITEMTDEARWTHIITYSI